MATITVSLVVNHENEQGDISSDGRLTGNSTEELETDKQVQSPAAPNNSEEEEVSSQTCQEELEEPEPNTSPIESPSSCSIKNAGFDEKFVLLKEFVEAKGTAQVPQRYIHPATGFKLGFWVQNVRHGYTKTTQEQRERLDALGFFWKVKDAGRKSTFEENMATLRKFHKEHGHACVPTSYEDPDSGLKLGRWVNHLRSGDRKLSPEQRQVLDAMGFVWQVKKMDNRSLRMPFDVWISVLKKYKERNGTLKMPQTFVDTDTGLKLGLWVSNLRRKKFNESQEKALTELGIDLKEAQESRPKVEKVPFESWIAMLEQYKAKHGHLFVQGSYVDPETGAKLGNFVHSQRKLKKQDKISKEQEAALDDIGFAWDGSNTKKWELIKQQQKEQQKARGDATGDAAKSEAAKSKTAASKSAAAKPAKSTSKEEKMPFEEWLVLLEQYKSKHGHLFVPGSYVDPDSGAKVGYFVHSQRRLKKDGKMSQEHESALDAAGFAWDGSNTKKWGLIKQQRREQGTAAAPAAAGTLRANPKRAARKRKKAVTVSPEDDDEEQQEDDHATTALPPPPKRSRPLVEVTTSSIVI